MEVAGLVVGVLPLIAEALKSYRKVYDTLRTFRYYSREVKRIKEQLEVCQQIFLNECSLLVHLIAGDQLTYTMFADTNHVLWQNVELEETLNKRLSKGYQTCKSIITNTRCTIHQMEDDLGSFDVLAEYKTKNEQWKTVIRRLRDSVKITFDKQRHEKNISELRGCNQDLRVLRSQLEEFRHKTEIYRPSQVRKRVPNHYSSIQQVSKTLHEALSGAWTCPFSTHQTHYGKLCIQAQVQDAVRLDMALSFETTSDEGSTDSRYESFGKQRFQANDLSEDRQEGHTWIYVQSAKIPQPNSLKHISGIDELPAALGCAQHGTHAALTDLQSSLESTVGPRPSKRQKGRFTDDCTAVQSSASSSVKTSEPRQIKEIQNICKHIEKAVPSERTGSGNCIGYLETQLFKHVFYSNDRARLRGLKGEHHSYQVVNLDHLLQNKHRPPALFGTAHKLRVAHSIATAVLQYNSTPWLRNDWRLKDMAYFGELSPLTDESLRTIHLSFRFNQKGKSAESTCTRWKSSMSKASDFLSVQDLQLQYGINNATIFSLGIALLELAYQQSLEDLCGSQDSMIVAARRLAASYDPLGPKFQRIIRQCLQCDFGMGSDLEQTELQGAIHQDVICRLEEMIQALSID